MTTPTEARKLASHYDDPDANALRDLADQLEALTAKRDSYKKDAERYQWLRKQHWNDSDFCVVSAPKFNVHLGTICPSNEMLDGAIDAAIKRAAT